MIAVAGTPQPKTQPQDAAPQSPRIDEHDADYRRLHARTTRRLTTSLRELVSELRTLPEPEHSQAQSRFITRHVALLREAYASGHAEGAKDYYGQVSRTPAKWARAVEPSARKLAAHLGFYAPSVAKMAHEAAMAWQTSVAQQRAASALSDAYGGMRLAGGDTATADPLDAWLVGVSGRVNLQAEIAWPGVQDGYAQAGAQDNANPFQFLYWILGAVQTEHCDDCPQYAANSPYNAPGSGGNELDATPGDGKTACGAGCKCYLSYQPGGQLEQQASDAIWSRWFNPQNLQAFATSSGIGADLGYGYDPAAVREAAATAAASPPQVNIPVPSDDDLSDEQKAALDAYRVAIDRWDAVRGDLAKAPAFYSARLDELFVGDGLPDLELMTPAQRIALFRLWDALQLWDDATGPEIEQDIDFDKAFSNGELGTYRLSNPYPREEHGHFGHGGDHGQHESQGGARQKGEGGYAKGEGKGRPGQTEASHGSYKKTGGGQKPPEGYTQIFTGGHWQPARISLAGHAVPIAGHEQLRFPNTPEGKTAMYGWMRDHAAGRLWEPEGGNYLLNNPYPREEHGHFGHGGNHGEHESKGEGREGGAKASSEHEGSRTEHVSARRAELDAKFGAGLHLSGNKAEDAEAVQGRAEELSQHVYQDVPELRRAIDIHLGGGPPTGAQTSHLSPQQFSPTSPWGYRADVEQAKVGLARLAEISEWSLLHHLDVTPEGTILLYHGTPATSGRAAWDERLRSGLARGTSFTDSREVADSSFSEGKTIIAAHVPVEAITTWYAVRGDTRFWKEHEYTVGGHGARVPITDYEFQDATPQHSAPAPPPPTQAGLKPQA